MRNTIYIVLVCLLASCSSSRLRPGVTVGSQESRVSGGSPVEAEIACRFNVPRGALPKRARLFIVPQLEVGDTVVSALEPVVVDGRIYSRKRHRREVLKGERDPYAGVARVMEGGESLDIPYRATLTLPEGVRAASVRAVVSTDGCGECTGVDSFIVARLQAPEPVRVEEPAAPERRTRIYHGRGEARLHFIVDKWDILPDFADNRRELDRMLDTLRAIVEDPACTLTSLSIYGMASAEARYAWNEMLARNRAASAREWLCQQLNLSDEQKAMIEIGSRPEGWEPVLKAMESAGDPDAGLVREIMAKYPGPTDDAAERHIRRLACWPRIVREYLPSDRRVVYTYSWTKTEEE